VREQQTTLTKEEGGDPINETPYKSIGDKLNDTSDNLFSQNDKYQFTTKDTAPLPEGRGESLIPADTQDTRRSRNENLYTNAGNEVTTLKEDHAKIEDTNSTG